MSTVIQRTVLGILVALHAWAMRDIFRYAIVPEDWARFIEMNSLITISLNAIGAFILTPTLAVLFALALLQSLEWAKAFHYVLVIYIAFVLLGGFATAAQFGLQLVSWPLTGTLLALAVIGLLTTYWRINEARLVSSLKCNND